MADNNNSVPLKPAVPNPNNQEATKYYIFNETGNIMLASTTNSSEPIQQSAQKAFAEVSVFFAAMVRALSSTINPKTKRPYSLYNYEAMGQIISQSGLFVHVTEEDVRYQTSDCGASFSKGLVESLLGLATGAGEMAFASAMVASVGKEALRIAADSSDTESRVSNIVFVCEYLLGMPTISAIVVYANCSEHVEHIKAGPCFSMTEIRTSWTLHKDTYLFITPTFIREYASDLDTAESSPDYVRLVHWLQELIEQTPAIEAVLDEAGSVVGNKLSVGITYTIVGRFLGATKGKLLHGSTSLSCSDWSDTEIKFSVDSVAEAAPIDIQDAKSGKTIVSTPSFTVVAAEQNNQTTPAQSAHAEEDQNKSEPKDGEAADTRGGT